MEELDRKTNKVDITITAPSDNEMDGLDSYDEDEIYEDDGDNSGSLSENSESYNETEENKQAEKEDDKSNESSRDEDGEKLCDEFNNGMNLNEEKPAREEKENEDAVGENVGPNYEIVGDRVLVEKDGKFELVDANEIKAEYFGMLGIKAESSEGGAESEKSESTVDNSSKDKSEEPLVKERPKTTPARGPRSNNTATRVRAQSSWGDRYRNSEYAKIRSPYGLSEKQLEVKKKREEAIARRKREEEEREREEERRKREDAERAFQVYMGGGGYE